MAAPTVEWVSTTGKGAATVTPTYGGTVVANDILIAFAETLNTDTFDPAAELGMADVPNTPVTQGGTTLWAKWVRAAGGETAPTLNDAGDHQIVKVICIRGCPTSGDPWDATPTPSTDATSDTSGSITGYSTADVDRLVVFGMAGDLPDVNGTAQYSGFTNAALSSITEQGDDSTNGGNGGSLGVYSGIKATSGAIGTSTYTKAAAAVKAHIVIALKSAPPVADLVIADTAHAHTVDGLALTQIHQLAVADSGHGHTVDNAVLTQVHVLTVADATQAHTADNVVLVAGGATDLVIADATHGQSADNLALTQVHSLAVADATHAQAVDGLALTQVHSLAVADAGHAHATDNVALTQVHNLVIQDAAQAQTVDNLAIDSATQLVIADAVHGHTADAVVLTQVHVLEVSAADHAHTADQLALTQLHELAINSAVHVHSADEVVWAVSGPTLRPYSGVTPQANADVTLRPFSTSTPRP